VDLVLVDTRSGKRRPIVLGSESIVLGSGVDCDVVVPSPEVPDRACQVSANREGIVLESLHPGGFTLNERPARAAILHPGDVVKLGPFQLVAASFSTAEREPEPEPADSPPAVAPPPDFDDELRAPRDSQYAARRRRRQQNEVVVVALLVLLGGGGLFLAWQRGAFRRGPPPDLAGDSGTPANGSSSPDSSSPSPASSSSIPAAADDPAESEDGAAEERGWRKPSSPEEVAETLAKVAKLLELEEFARCRWLLWRLSPTTESDHALVDKRRKEVDEAAKKGGDEHLRFVEELTRKGKLAAALGHCEEESIERFRGLETWYRLLEKADEIEALLNERVPETLRPKSTRKHARPMPSDLATRSPPPAKTSMSEEMGATDRAPAARARPADSTPRPPRPTPTEPERAPPPPPPTPEELAAASAVGAALKELVEAKPAAFESAAKKVADSARAAKERAAEPLLARCDELAAALEQAPERAALAELRQRVQVLVDARAAALAFLADEQRYFVLDPKAPGDVSRGGELDKAQKEADRLVGAVREIWGSEQGGAPAPQVPLSDGFARLVREARLIDDLLREVGRSPPDRAELLGARLLPLWAPKLSVRNYALDLEERRRIDADRQVKTRNQQIKDVKDSDDLELLFLTNAYREMLGRPQLDFDRKLYDDARTYSELMAKQLKGAKESDPQPDPTPRMAGSKPSGGANYLRGHFSARQALQAWCRGAAAHRNLVDAQHRTMAAAGVGIFWAQLFGLGEGAAPK